MQGVFPSNVIQDFLDAFHEIIVVESADMVEVSTQRIAQKMKDEAKKTIWIEITIGKNAGGDIIYAKQTYRGKDKPSWIPAGLE